MIILDEKSKCEGSYYDDFSEFHAWEPTENNRLFCIKCKKYADDIPEVEIIGD